MSFGFGGGFGASSSPFGTTAPSPFGQSAPAFGQNTSPFGATTTTGVFGQSQPAFGATPTFGASAPAFGAPQSAPAFGAASTPAFGGSSFGAPAPGGFGFGASSASPFGAASTPAFGAASTPAFGAASAPAFGATPSPFGGGAFGQSAPAFGAASTPAFGVASTPAFGQTLSAFGSTSFGAAPTPGFQTPGFGAAAPQRGTRGAAWRKTQETDTSGTSGAKTTVFYNSISCMPEYSGKSAEELRWEDYQDGCKGGPGTPSTSGSGLFGSPSPFGGAAPAAAPSPFGTPASTPAFGAPQSAPAFGGFGGAASTPAFGAPQSTPAFGFGASSASPFGGMSTPAFGQASSPAFGGMSTPAFGATSSPAFGAPSSTPAFGALQSAPAFGGFGATSTPAFGAPQSAPAFGGFGAPQSTPSAFGAASAPAFGASSAPFSFAGASTPAFGAASSASLFGAASSTSLFGAASTPAFGAAPTPSLFGAKPATGGFSFPSPTSTPAFGATASTPAPAFGGMSGGLFGTPQTSTPAFSFASQPVAAPSFSLMPAGQQQPVQAPSVGVNPYGSLPAARALTPLPEYRVGLTQQQRHQLASPVAGPPRPVALITPRTLTPRLGTNLRARQGAGAPTSFSRLSRTSSANPLFTNGTATPGSVGAGTPVANGNGTPSPSVFVARDDPRKLFVREPLPSTEGAMGITSSPAMAGGAAVTPGRSSLRTPGVALRPTPSSRERPSGGGEVAEPSGADALGAVSDAELAALLPLLQRSEYYTEPSLSQLAAMARDDPMNLSSVSNLTVGRRGVGHVRWLDPTDVRGLDLDSVVELSRGSIEVYLDDATKPEVGSGLNKPAEVTMFKVFKTDKETGRPTNDPEAVERFTRKLKRVAAEQGARFVSYDPSTGTWRFEVEHFSRYGLADSSDEEDHGEYVMVDEERSSDDDSGVMLGVKRSAMQQQQQQHEDGPVQGGGSAAEEIEAVDDADPGVGFNKGSDVERLVLPEAAGMRTDTEPQELQRIREGLFGNARAPPAKHRRIIIGPDALTAMDEDALLGLGGGAPSPAPAPKAPQLHAWRRQKQAPLAPPVSTGPASQQQHPKVPLGASALVAGRSSAAYPPGTPLQLISPSATVRPSPGSLAKCPIPAPLTDAVQQMGSERCIPDSGLFLGRSFGVGWAPGGCLIVPGGAKLAHEPVQGTDHSAGTVSLHRLVVGSGVVSDTDQVEEYEDSCRERVEAALQLHLEYSSPDEATQGSSSAIQDTEDEAAQILPRWRLRCDRFEELRAFTLEHMQLCTQAATKSTSSMERVVLRYQAAAWELVHALFSSLPAERQEQLQLDEDDGMGVDALYKLIAFERRAEISRWLADRSRHQAERALAAAPAGEAGTAARILALLAAHQVPAATAIAASSGNIRLATLLAGAGTTIEGQKLVELQLTQWHEAGFDTHMEPGLHAVYTVLAGDVDSIIPSMALDWRGALGMHLWYAKAGASASHDGVTSIRDAVASYEAAVAEGKAPPPLPGYMDDAGVVGANDEQMTDVSYELLKLAAVLSQDEGNDDDDQLLGRLLRSANVTPDCMDSSFAWFLLSTLSAVNAIDPSTDHPSACLALTGLISQLEALGGLAHWTVFVALHLPDDAPPATEQQQQGDGLSFPGPGLREQVVRRLLMVHCPEWSSDPDAVDFLTSTVKIPRSWLAAAQFHWEAYAGDEEAALNELLVACEWNAAHAALCKSLAPLWLLSGEATIVEHLAPALAALRPRASKIAGWSRGGGVYAAYLELSRTYSALRKGNIESAWSHDERMAAGSALADALRDFGTTAAWRELPAPQPGSDERGTALRRAAQASMAQQVSKWLIGDADSSDLVPNVQRAAIAANIRGLPQGSLAGAVAVGSVTLAAEAM